MPSNTEKSLLATLAKSAEDVFETMVFMKVKCDEPVEEGQSPPLVCGLAGTIGLTGENVCGNMALLFSRELAEKIFKSMMMNPDCTVQENELCDAVGELANMVAGGAKAKLQDNGIRFDIGLPSVVVGEKYRIESPHGTKSYLTVARVEDKSFIIKLSLSQ